MPITHINRKGQTYTLHVGTTRAGNPKYFFSRSSEGALAEQLPEDLEIYEQPTGQVSVRRARPQVITDEELQVLEGELARAPSVQHAYVDRDREVMTVFVADVGDLEAIQRKFAPFVRFEPSDIKVRYDPVFKFVLVDVEERTFQAQRYCYRGSIDRWIFVGSAGSLAEVARRNLVHINKDSYYELW